MILLFKLIFCTFKLNLLELLNDNKIIITLLLLCMYLQKLLLPVGNLFDATAQSLSLKLVLFLFTM